MDPLTLSTLLGAAGSIGGGLLSRSGNQETKQQRLSRKTVEDLLASLKGNGPYSNLFKTDEAAFQKSFVDPAKTMFKNQIAPQIQQQYIANGQQGNSGLDDQLLRAGVDLDQMLNQNYMQYQQGAQDRMSNALNAIIGAGPGAAAKPSIWQTLGQSTAGYLSSDSFGDLLKSYRPNQPNRLGGRAYNSLGTPKGFSPDWGS